MRLREKELERVNREGESGNEIKRKGGRENEGIERQTRERRKGGRLDRRNIQ